MKILITGGHITTALAVIEELQKHSGVEIVVVGRKYAVDHENTESFEYKILKEKGIPFVHVPAGRLTRSFSIYSLISILKFPVGFINAFSLLKTEKPTHVLSFGGYIALPVAISAYFLGIPVFTHEQTMRPGSTNRFIARFAQKVFISFKEAEKYFPSDKTVLTGNPVRAFIRGVKEEMGSRPTLLIMGGSLGSHSINLHIEKIVDELTKTFTVIHQTGNVAQYGDHARLKEKESELYKLFEHLDDKQLAMYYAQSSLVVSRSGANTVCELIALQKPSVLIPLPWAANAEQQAQADFMQNNGVSEIFDQHQESSVLLQKILSVHSNSSKYRENFVYLKDQQSLIAHAAPIIVDELIHEKNS